MQTVEEWVLSQLNTWLKAGRRSWLCTLVSIRGAAPRPVGSLLALNDAGEVVGSLSGGCVEEDLLERVRVGELARDQIERVPYGISAEQNERLGLPCGGHLEILVEPFTQIPEALPALLAALAARRCVRREVSLDSGRWQVDEVEHIEPLSCNEVVLRQGLGPRFQLLLVGANELARCVAELATGMDYRVMVCDPRPAMREQWRPIRGVDLIEGMPDDVVRERANDRYSIVITLTHDPRIDDMALMEALVGEAFYVGALGSARTSAGRRERLLQLDLSEQQIARLHAPVGLPIGSKSAMEIAVAIMAELVSLRRLGRGSGNL